MRVLVVGERGREVVEACAIAAGRGAEVRHRGEIEAALADLREGRGADLLLADVRLDISALVRRLEAERIWLPVVAYGIDAEPRAAGAAIRAGAKEFVPLPPDPQLIAALIASLAGDARELVSEDPAMQAVIALARQYAPAEASVLITGESGTGKEVMARFIHRHSRRSGGPFVSVNCAAIPDNLLESELFGHERGAFTGAVARRIGKFEEANGGTLLLDEITEMDPRLQAKLLRAIQEREIDRVGGTRPVKVDIRLIATSNRDLRKAVEAGVFREDLYFRLNVLGLHLPPLRERPRDIEVLARHFASNFARLNGLPERAPSPEALALLLRHPWRGNVRELENCMHRAVLLARGPTIGPEAILLAPSTNPPVLGATPSPLPATLVGRTIAEVERDLIIDTLRHTAGNRTHAATILGISIRTLRNKLKQYAEEGVAIPPPGPETVGRAAESEPC
ncbi:MAG: sigma-54 dependent transcriptional regulator [Geminicoccaceae bacterium]|nr:sigma-54 dependent transcriptional regulator [Geminicoccaceae bacterium]MCX8101107.1 sigma-54 dependent transcriptional regulator [Geminicoccaceae bacterium]MDW8370192.1 sigma-54 dependent transcriptional regulator [Geminicoccaceae bacterium]